MQHVQAPLVSSTALVGFGVAVLATAPRSSAQTLTAPVPLPGDAVVEPSAGIQDRAAIARGAAGYLAVWEDDRAAASGTAYPPDGVHPNTDVVGVVLDELGRPVTPAPVVVDASPWDQRHVRVAWNGATYLVVWQSTRPNAGWRTEGVYAARVSATGAVLDPTPLRIADLDDDDETSPVVASVGGDWLVAWASAPSSTGIPRFEGALVSPGGAVAPKHVLVPAGGFEVTNPALAAAGGVYALAHERSFSGVEVRRFGPSLGALGAPTSLGAGVWPAIASDGSSFYVAWRGPGGIRGTPLSASGAVGAPGLPVLSTGLGFGAAHLGAAHDGASWVVAWDNDSAIHAARVAPSGAQQGAAFTVTASAVAARDAAVAGGNGAAVVLWTDSRRSTSTLGIDREDVFGALVPGSGPLPADHAVSVSPPIQVEAKVAGDDTHGYLVAFKSSSSGRVRIAAQRVDRFGVALDPEPLVLRDGDTTAGALDVAFDGAAWLVAWSERAVNQPAWTRCQRIAASGALLDPAPVLLQEGQWPCVAAVGGVFLVVSHYHFPPVQSNEVLRFRRLRGADGALLDAAPIPIAFGSGKPAIVGFDDRWLVAWGAVRAAFVDASGVPGAPFLAAETGGLSSEGALPALGRVGDVALLAWRYSGIADIHARRITKLGALLDSPVGSTVSGAPHGQLAPTVAGSGAEYLVAWSDWRRHHPLEPGLGDVYGCRVDAANQPLDPSGFAIHAAWPAAEGHPDAAGDAGRVLIVSPVAFDGAAGAFCGHRVVLRSLVVGHGARYCAQAAPNSTGLPGRLAVTGSLVAQANALFLEAYDLPPQQFGMFLTSRVRGFSAHPAGSQGDLCLGGTIGRFRALVQTTSASGAMSIRVDLAALPIGAGVVAQAGDTWCFQAWHRDANPGPATNFTDAVEVALD